MALNNYERETTITSNDADEYVRIWTAQRKVISRLLRNDRFILDRQGDHEGSEWVEGRVAVKDWSPLGGFKRHVSEEQRDALSERAKQMKAEGKGIFAKES